MTKKIASVTIMPGCVSCGACQALCPDIFEVKGISKVKPGADLNKHADLIREAAEMCPVSVITYAEHE